MSFCIEEIYPQYIFLKQIISDKLLLVKKKNNNNFNGKFKLKPIIIYYLWFFCKNVMCVILLFIFTSIEYRQFPTSPLL